jgi:ATP-dependent DNA ligase
VVARPLELPYREGERVLMKVKHERTADCVVGGFRWHKSARGPGGVPQGKGVIGSLLLGLYDEAGSLHHVGVTAAFPMAQRRALVDVLAPYGEDALTGHPWAEWASHAAQAGSQRLPGGQSRWSAGRDMSWEPVRPELVAEVRYDHLQGDRFRHAAQFIRWRTDRSPSSCTYSQLEEVPPAELASIFGQQT